MSDTKEENKLKSVENNISFSNTLTNTLGSPKDFFT